MRTVYTCGGDPPMCDNKGAEKNKGGRCKERGAEGEQEGWRGHYTDSHDRDWSEYDTRFLCGQYPPMGNGTWFCWAGRHEKAWRRRWGYSSAIFGALMHAGCQEKKEEAQGKGEGTLARAVSEDSREGVQVCSERRKAAN